MPLQSIAGRWLSECRCVDRESRSEIELRSDRFTNFRNAKFEKRAPAFPATEFTTFLLPASTSTSVTGSVTYSLFDIAKRCCWLSELATETRVRTSTRFECRRTGSATRIDLSAANLFMQLTRGVIGSGEQPCELRPCHYLEISSRAAQLFVQRPRSGSRNIDRLSEHLSYATKPVKRFPQSLARSTLQAPAKVTRCHPLGRSNCSVLAAAPRQSRSASSMP